MDFSNTSIEALTFTTKQSKRLDEIEWQIKQSKTFDDIMKIISENCVPIGKVIDLAHLEIMQMIAKFINLDDPSEEITKQYLLEYKRATEMNDRSLQIVDIIIEKTPLNTTQEIKRATNITFIIQKVCDNARVFCEIDRIIIANTITREKDSSLTVKPDCNNNDESPANPQFTSSNFIECNQPEDNSALSRSGDKEPEQQPLNLNSRFCKETYTHDKAEKSKIEKNNNQKSYTALKVGFALLTTCCFVAAELYRSASLYMVGVIATIATCYFIFSPQLPSTELTLTELIQNSQDTQKIK